MEDVKITYADNAHESTTQLLAITTAALDKRSAHVMFLG